MAAAAVKKNAAGKRKRTRKTKRRTTAAAEEDASSDSGSGSEDDEKASRATIVKAAVRAPSPAPSSSDSSSSSSEEDEQPSKPSTSNGETGKRRRKRTRKTKQSQVQAGESTANDDTPAKPATAPAPTPAPADVDAFKSLADPSTDARLSDATKASLAYAKQYALDRPAWKFSKARQEHLIRHMLSKPAAQVEGAETEEATISADAQEEPPAHAPSWWPDEWNACVGYYLSTVQGGAKARLVDRLRAAARQTIPDAPPSAPVQAPEAGTTDAAVKSVSFADMAAQADQQDAAQQQGAVDPATATANRELALFESTRARALLTAMGLSPTP